MMPAMISFVLPIYNCYDEFREYFPYFSNWLQIRGISFEIIIIDDHSDDRQDISNLVDAPGITYLYNEKNFGKGYSVKKGFMTAKGSWLVFMDGDFPFDLTVIDKIENIAKAGDADMIIGDRTQKDSSYPVDLSFLRKQGSRVLSAVASRFFTADIYDTQCGIKGFRKSVATDLFGQLTQNRFSFDLEILFLATRKKLRIERVPVTVRQQKSSSVRILRDGFITIASLFSIYLNRISGKYKI